jgi:AraC-like DNA-binding protein
MTPGSIMLGSPGHAYECRHDHGAGDRCVSFWYEPEYVDRLAADMRLQVKGSPFRGPALPALRETAGVIARSGAGLLKPDTDWSECALQVAARVLTVAARPRSAPARASASALDRVSSIVRFIDQSMEDADALSLERLAARVDLSPFHFLRTFGRVTGLTPHQYVRRTRLRLAATRLATDRSHILDVALDSGFGDVSAFNRAFRTEFGVSPRQYRRGR